MDTSALKKFAQDARRQLLEQVAARMEQVLSTDSVEIREKEKAVRELREQIRSSSKEAVIDRVAYTWFNRFCALRYMDVNHYTRMGVVSPLEGFTQPEILQEAKQGVIDNSFEVNKQRVFALLNGQLPSSNPQQEAYRLLLVGACNAYHAQMPFLFPKIEDYTELLMPDDLLSENSILHAVRSALDEDACQDVEVIGWLYQYYISERKDEVFAALKKRKKIEAEDIPAATQLFTPHWIVRYLVENSLGRLWMLNHPESKLIEQMDYYIKPKEAESNYLEITSPEEIKVCDPACGSGHMLTYAFDLLYAVYEEEGYDPVQISSLILQHNLYGIEIDKRAGDLAAFALVMKARAKDRRFFNREIKPNICVLENITFTPEEIKNYKKAVGPDLFNQELWFLLQQFEQAESFGSLIRPQVQNPKQILDRLEELGVFNDLFLNESNKKVKQALKFSEFLNPRYHVVVANPPYMGLRKLNQALSEIIKVAYKDSKSDLYSAFIEKNFSMLLDLGYQAMITIPNWMFLSSFAKLRKIIIQNHSIISLIFNGRGVWGPDYGSCQFILKKCGTIDEHGVYQKLFHKIGSVNSNNVLKSRFDNQKDFPRYRLKGKDFLKIPQSRISFWIGKELISLFENKLLGDIGYLFQGMITGENKEFVRYWFEVAKNNSAMSQNTSTSIEPNLRKWVPYNKGGEYRKWYGNHYHVVNWENRGEEFITNRPKSSKAYFKEYISWSYITISKVSARYYPNGFLWDVAGSGLILEDPNEIYLYLGYLNSEIGNLILQSLNPTINLQVENISAFPAVNPPSPQKEQLIKIAKDIVSIHKSDWDEFEISWNFQEPGFLNVDGDIQILGEAIDDYVEKSLYRAKKAYEMEKLLNEIIQDLHQANSVGIQPTMIQDITLKSNPYFGQTFKSNDSHGNQKSKYLKVLVLEFLSYAVGCFFGRYSVDKGGLILANAESSLKDYLLQIPDPKYIPVAENVIPVLEGEWFEDDIAERFKNFLKITFGEENFEENLTFLEEAIGRDIRSYFVRDFYNEHVKMYKKRPIYWLFSSPKGSFNALIYMHRYRPDTISVILNDYLVQYREKLTAYKALLETRSISASASQGEKTKALKEIEQINKVLSELKEYEDEILYPLATQQIEIDLDDGVKVNYNKFGKALKKVAGLSE